MKRGESVEVGRLTVTRLTTYVAISSNAHTDRDTAFYIHEDDMVEFTDVMLSIVNAMGELHLLDPSNKELM